MLCSVQRITCSDTCIFLPIDSILMLSRDQQSDGIRRIQTTSDVPLRHFTATAPSPRDFPFGDFVRPYKEHVTTIVHSATTLDLHHSFGSGESLYKQTTSELLISDPAQIDICFFVDSRITAISAPNARDMSWPTISAPGKSPASSHNT